MAELFTSDTHFGHKNVIRYDERPFRDMDHMREMLIKNWNDTVTPSDTVYHLGDVAFLGTTATREIVNRLNGRKILIRGNHDGSWEHSRNMGFDEVHDNLFL